MYLDPAHHGLDDLTSRGEVGGRQPVRHPRGELLQSADDQPEFGLECPLVAQDAHLLRERTRALPEVRDPRLELALVDQPLRIAVDQARDAPLHRVVLTP
jgi:hypothetical protein